MSGILWACMRPEELKILVPGLKIWIFLPRNGRERGVYRIDAENELLLLVLLDIRQS